MYREVVSDILAEVQLCGKTHPMRMQRNPIYREIQCKVYCRRVISANASACPDARAPEFVPLIIAIKIHCDQCVI